jgi:triacylglycerol lipase
MSSRHLVDPELLAVIDRWPTVRFTRETLPALRENLAATYDSRKEDGLPISVERRLVATAAGSPDVSLILYRPQPVPENLPALFYIHGGGYVSGSAAMMAAQHRSLAADLKCLVVAVDYRLAPETSHPGPLEDCYSGLRWLWSSAHKLGIDATRIAICGNSAGGGLAAALTQLVRDRSEFSVAFQYLLNPMLDDRTGVTDEPNPYTGEFVWTREHNRFGWSALLGREPGGDDVSAYAAPARARDLSRLPPCFISVGSLDLFLDECLDYARRLLRAGVPTELHVYPGAFHGSSMVPDAAISIRAERHGREALRRALKI